MHRARREQREDYRSYLPDQKAMEVFSFRSYWSPPCIRRYKCCRVHGLNHRSSHRLDRYDAPPRWYSKTTSSEPYIDDIIVHTLQSILLPHSPIWIWTISRIVYQFSATETVKILILTTEIETSHQESIGQYWWFQFSMIYWSCPRLFLLDRSDALLSAYVHPPRNLFELVRLMERHDGKLPR
jgi:hypothetical protein